VRHSKRVVPKSLFPRLSPVQSDGYGLGKASVIQEFRFGTMNLGAPASVLARLRLFQGEQPAGEDAGAPSRKDLFSQRRSICGHSAWVRAVVSPRPAGTPENSPAIHRWVPGQSEIESRQGRKNTLVQPQFFFRPNGALLSLHPQPTVETVGSSPSGLSGTDSCLHLSLRFSRTKAANNFSRRIL